MALQARRSRSEPKLENDADSDSPLISIFDAARNMIDLPRRNVSAARNGLRYREFLDALGVAVYTTDADGRITFYNEAAATFWSRRPELGEEWCGSLRLF
jgi:PAS domain-containing protein